MVAGVDRQAILTGPHPVGVLFAGQARGFEAVTHESAHQTYLFGELLDDEAMLAGVDVRTRFNDLSACLAVYFHDELGEPGTKDVTFEVATRGTFSVTASSQKASRRESDRPLTVEVSGHTNFLTANASTRVGWAF